MKTYIKGIFNRYIYEGNNGYVIGSLTIKDTNTEYINKQIIFTGYFEELHENDIYILYGDIVNHPKYGMQFSVQSYEKIKPDDIDGVKQFLCSDLFSGIGEKMASSIVDILGEDALNKIIDDKNCLTLIPKLSLKKANLIYDTLIKYEESHKTIVYLTELGFTMRMALIIYNLYKSKTIMIVEHNIYDILDQTHEISFTKVDQIALKNNTYDEISRVKACIIYIMDNLVYQNGDTYLTYDLIKMNTLNYLGYEIDDELFNDYLNELYIEGKIYIENNYYYPINIYKSEMIIVGKINRLLNNKIIKRKDIDDVINNLEDKNQITYDDMQKEAIKNALENRISIITGGPGTGKTTIIKTIVESYIILHKLSNSEIDSMIALLAPTGRASKRLSESTGYPSLTIHRFLKWNKENDEFGVNEYNKTFQKLIIIDEASMLDINLLACLFKGLTYDIQIVFVGDVNQLPSVGPGQILKDMIESGKICCTSLEILYRQNSNSYIPYIAHNIKNNIEFNFLEPHDDYLFINCSINNIKTSLIDICLQLKSQQNNLKNVQVMAPTYLGINGIDEVNKEIQKIFNPKDNIKKEIVVGDIIFRENDKVMQLVNMPDDNVFNGDIGYISKIIPANISESKKNEIYVDYDGVLIKYLPKDFNKIKHGFIISIHKSQGSEFDIVIMLMSLAYSRMLYRKLIYTGVTRAKKKLILIGEKEAFIRGINNNSEYLRKTLLKEKIMNSH